MNNYPRAIWRLIETPPRPGAWNMAADEAILEATGRGAALPTLRLYAWEPPCLSLGFSQPASDVDPACLTELGWDLVRRPTGGRAILHTDELTYSVAGPPAEPRLAGGVLESYRRLSSALLAALHRLQIPAEAKRTLLDSDPEKPDPVCFETPSSYEITVGQKKLIGSAQMRRKEGVLQHGSLPLYGDLGRITQGLAFPDEQTRQAAAERLLARATTVESVAGQRINWKKAAQTLTEAFAEILNLEFVPGGLTPAEEARAAELVEAKYASPAWTLKIP